VWSEECALKYNPDIRLNIGPSARALQQIGEGTLLKNEPWPYDAVALRSSVVGYVPRRTFFALLERSVDFNRFLLLK
jgi:hypothetical protein